MKKQITAIALGVITFITSSEISDARPHGGHCYQAPQNIVYVSGYRHGRPIYTEKIFVGYNCHGRPQFTYRTYCTPQPRYVERCAPVQPYISSHPAPHFQHRPHPSIRFTYCR